MNPIARLRDSDRWIPWTFVAFFLVVVAVNGVMATLAVTSWTGLVTENAYRRGVEYNKQLEASRAQAALGWHVALGMTREGRNAIVDVALADRFRQAIDDAEIGARLMRPTHAGEDVAIAFEAMGEGRYRATIEPLEDGLWDLHLLVTRNGETHRSLRRLSLR